MRQFVFKPLVVALLGMSFCVGAFGQAPSSGNLEQKRAVREQQVFLLNLDNLSDEGAAKQVAAQVKPGSYVKVTSTASMGPETARALVKACQDGVLAVEGPLNVGAAQVLFSGARLRGLDISGTQFVYEDGRPAKLPLDNIREMMERGLKGFVYDSRSVDVRPLLASGAAKNAILSDVAPLDPRRARAIQAEVGEGAMAGFLGVADGSWAGSDVKNLMDNASGKAQVGYMLAQKAIICGRSDAYAYLRRASNNTDLLSGLTDQGIERRVRLGKGERFTAADLFPLERGGSEFDLPEFQQIVAGAWRSSDNTLAFDQFPLDKRLVGAIPDRIRLQVTDLSATNDSLTADFNNITSFFRKVTDLDISNNPKARFDVAAVNAMNIRNLRALVVGGDEFDLDAKNSMWGNLFNANALRVLGISITDSNDVTQFKGVMRAHPQQFWRLNIEVAETVPPDGQVQLLDAVGKSQSKLNKFSYGISGRTPVAWTLSERSAFMRAQKTVVDGNPGLIEYGFTGSPGDSFRYQKTLDFTRETKAWFGAVSNQIKLNMAAHPAGSDKTLSATVRWMSKKPAGAANGQIQFQLKEGDSISTAEKQGLVKSLSSVANGSFMEFRAKGTDQSVYDAAITAPSTALIEAGGSAGSVRFSNSMDQRTQEPS